MVRFALMLLGGLAMAQPVSAGFLDSLLWKKRVFLVFSDDAAAVARQLASLPLRELGERDLMVLVVPSRGDVRGVAGSLDPLPSPASLRNDFGVAHDVPFLAVLVGKDGGVKARETAPMAAATLFGLIDQMPMRRQEMQAR
ncbi:hypothetical protein Sa4125_35190 [Aureimonas sp. SA4125]|uniref:DUF4174 domain-containing protein n=1 Tax=Aureimonas sp. SA4125 TaxID=2826993 RepID=UPI001CC59B82|nr:DUF4174 domain-containing protein [Aureimonas sp. SA4125]BDA85977.1 hypothetical protein Sa4125_35190 [Aureimonas sp. SA4125]